MSNIATKSALRIIAKQNLKTNLPSQSTKSSLIWDRLSELERFQLARRTGRMMIYLDFNGEVQTTRFLDFSTPVMVPCCENNEIVPVRIDSLDELEMNSMGIKEPSLTLRAETGRRCTPNDIDLVIVPGLAFDTAGNRLGRGKGFYDRFLGGLSPSTLTVALAFECQIFETVPTDARDKRVDLIVTEDRIITPG